ncbi:MAG TPA: efflux RND transporter periplasmic adaptor subunit [Phycisphaerae bacterium]|nr:efflux RND transporter periplasmic adaptor subunit [Phycisphaerae bacterium]
MTSNRASHFARRAALTFCLLAGCNSKGPPSAALPPAEVTVSRPLVQEVTDSIDYTGTTAAVASVEIRARVTGFLDQIHFQPRQKVKKDQLLFTIDPRPFQHAFDSAKASLASLQSELVKAKFDAEKVADLFKEGNAAKDELVAKTSRRDALIADIAKVTAELETARLNLDWCSVTAPINGRISRNLVDPGNVITADVTPLANIVDDDPVYVYFNASEHDVLTVRQQILKEAAEAEGKPATSQGEIRGAHWPLQMALMTERGYPHKGELDYTAPEVNSSTGTLQVRGVFSNPDAYLLAGLFVRLRLPLGKPHSALLVTERALGSDQGQRYLLVVNDKNVVDYRPVRVGSLQEGLRVIESGISANDQVIVNGIQRVRPGVTVKPVAAPMPVMPADPNGANGQANKAPATQPGGKP